MKPRDVLSLALTGGALLVSVLAVGGVLPWTQALVAALVAAALLVQLPASRGLARVSPLLVLIAVAFGLTLIQVIPLPPSIVELLDKTGAHLRADGAAITGTKPWSTISLDPGGTLRGLAYFAILFGIATLSLRLAASERGRMFLLGGVAATCGLAALVAAGHTLVGATSLYGVYEPAHVFGPPIFGSLLNPNHLGCLMAIGAVVSLAIAFYPHQPAQLRAVWIVNGLGCMAVGALTQSRGAILGMGLGFVVAGSLVVVHRLEHAGRQRARSFRNDMPVAIVVGLGIAIGLYTTAGNVTSQIEATSTNELQVPISKYAAWKSSAELVRESPWVGIGRGAIEANLPRVHPGSAYFTYSHLENEYVEAVVDWGIPGAVALAAVLAWCVRVAMRRWRDGPLAAAALGAMSALMFQSAVDFGVELLGIAVPATIIASTVQLVPLRPLGTPYRVRARRAALIALLGVISVVVVLPAAGTLQEDRDAVRALQSPTIAQLHALVELHPLDYFAFAKEADIASSNHDVHAVDYLNQALALHPTHPGLHQLAARMLVGNKRFEQAGVEYALAMRAEARPLTLLQEVVILMPTPEACASAIPVDYPIPDLILHSLKELKREDVSELWLARVADSPQHDMRIIDTLYDLAMLRHDYDVARTTAELRLRISRTTVSRLDLAKVKFEQKAYDELLTELAGVREWNGRIRDKADAWLILCDVHIQRKEWDPALECLHRLDASGLVVAGGGDTSKRIKEIEEQREFEAKMHAVEKMERELGVGSGASK